VVEVPFVNSSVVDEVAVSVSDVADVGSLVVMGSSLLVVGSETPGAVWCRPRPGDAAG
jgi:hypothetical protein